MVSKRKILLADDSETVQKVVNLTFELEGIEVVTFGDGDSAMAQFATVAPDVVLADVNMPGLDGYQICQNIKSDEATKNTPVILLVGSFEPFDEQRATEVGADDYLTKPFQSIRQLVAKVNELLAPKAIDEFDDIHLNDTLEMKDGAKEVSYFETSFGDPGMDDEMIQTSQVGSVPVDETAKYVTPDNSQFEEPDNVSKTQPLSAKDLQYIYSQEKSAEDSSQIADEPIDEPDEPAAVEPETTESFAAEETNFENTDERGFNFVDQQTVEETATPLYEADDLNKDYSEVADDNDFGTQPDDIGHFYREPDYADEVETIETPVYPGAAEQTDFEQVETVSQNDETGFEIVDHNSFQNATNFVAQTEIANADESEKQSFDNDETEQESAFENVDAVDETEDKTSVVDLAGEAASEPLQILSPVPVLDFDELDLLEVSFPENRPTSFVETPTETEDVLSEEPPNVEETIEVQNEDETEEVKSQVAEQLSGVNLSAADIDAIANKVVEKLTARLKE